MKTSPTFACYREFIGLGIPFNFNTYLSVILVPVLLLFMIQPRVVVAQKGDAVEVTAARGTGRTTGHIITLAVKNKTDSEVRLSGAIFYIPSSGKYQDYVGRIPDGTVIDPGATVNIPVDGYCTDIHTPPVPDGEPAPDFDQWVQVGDPVTQPSQPGDPGTPNVTATPKYTADPFSPDDIPEIVNNPGFTRIIPDPVKPIHVTYPGTDIPVNGNIDPSKDPVVFAPILVEYVEVIEDAADIIQGSRLFTTPFTPDPVKEKEAIVQHTIWITTGLLQDEDYVKDQFKENLYDQFEIQTGQIMDSISAAEEEKLAVGVDAFWETFTATGIAAKVIRTGDNVEGNAINDSVGERVAEATAAAATAAKSKRCIRIPEDPQIDPDGGYDLMGQLYHNGLTPVDPLNHFRDMRIKHKLWAIQTMHASLEGALNGEFNAFPCDDELSHNPDHFLGYPDFPFDDIFLEVDLCADNSDKDELIDFLSPDASVDSLNKWMEEFEDAVDNLGLWNPNETPLMEGYQNSIERSLEAIEEAYSDFEESMLVTMELRFNRSRAEANLWSAVVTIAAAAVSGGLAAAAGGAWAAMASAFVSMTGFVYEQGLESMGMSPELASFVSSIVTLSLSVSQSWGNAFGELIEDEVTTGLPTDMMSAGAAAMQQQQQVEAFSMSMMMLDDDAWNALMAELDDDYNQDAIDQFNHHRDVLKAEIQRRVDDLCKVYKTLDALLPALEEAHEQAVQILQASFWMDLWRDAMDQAFDCCCEWSDGSGPDAICTFTIPEFGFDPSENN